MRNSSPVPRPPRPSAGTPFAAALAGLPRSGRARFGATPLGAPLIAAALLAACSGDPSAPASTVARPNLLFCVFDTTRADHLSAYGYERETSPTLDALAADGLLFERAWAQASLTPISVATMLTGALPYRHGIRSLFMVAEQRLSTDTPTLAELLGAEGWSTAGFVSAAPLSRRYGLDRGFDHFDDELGPEAAARAERGIGNAYQRRADETTERALAWLDTALDEPQPFALMVHFFDAHDATLVPPSEFLAQHVDFPLPDDLDGGGDLRRMRSSKRRIQLYDAEIRYQDTQLARLLEAIEASGRLDETLIVFVSDHGEGLGQHDHWTHGLLWSEQLHVPWILSGPGVPQGERHTDPVAMVDLLPTVAELLHVELPPAISADGVSALDTAPLEEREFYAEVHHAAGNHLGADPRMYSLTVGPWKYVHRPDGPTHELYDHASDPLELRNLYTPEHPVAALLRRNLESRGAIMGEAQATLELEGDLQAMLRDLGYL